jgi:hypothetical protein
LTGLRKGRLQPVRVNIQWRGTRRRPGPAVLGSSRLTIFSNLRSKRNRWVGDASARNEEKRRLARRVIVAGLPDLGNGCGQVYLARGDFPFLKRNDCNNKAAAHPTSRDSRGGLVQRHSQSRAVPEGFGFSSHPRIRATLGAPSSTLCGGRPSHSGNCGYFRS